MDTAIWKHIQPNNHERFHYLEPVPREADLGGVGTAELLLDFRRYFSLPAQEIERQLALSNGARRRCRLESPIESTYKRAMASIRKGSAFPLHIRVRSSWPGG